MGRRAKQTVDFFSHDCAHTKTLEILEGRFGNTGYALWFKLLEELGRADGHSIDFSDEIVLEHFSGAKLRISASETLQIIDFLARLSAIDPELWKKRVVWCQHFVDRLSDVYRKRKANPPQKPLFPPQESNIRDGNQISGDSGDVNPPKSPDTPQSKVEYSKVKNIKESADATLFQLPTKDEIIEKSIPKVKDDLTILAEKLYEEGVFPKVHAFKNQMLKEKRNPRAIVHALMRCYTKKPGKEEAWGYCTQIMKTEDGNYNEQDATRSM